MRRMLQAAAAALALVALAAPPALADEDGQSVYSRRCSSCHGQQGEGGGPFPALAGLPAMRDADFVESAVREGRPGMPGNGQLPPEQIEALVQYLVTSFGGGAGAKTGADGQAGESGDPGAADGSPLPAGDPARGESYFLGSARLENGGAPCVSCHAAGNAGNLAGGLLGPALTGLVAKFGGEAGVAGVLAQPAFRVMRASYAGKALSDQERADLAAFFAAAAEGRVSGGAPFPRSFWLVSVLGAGGLFLAMGLFWPRRGTSPAQRLRGNA